MKKNVQLFIFIVLLSVSLFSVNADAKVKNYVVGNSNKNYLYKLDDLKTSFINFKSGVGDTKIYLEFILNLSNGEFIAFQDESGKYVSYQDIINAFMEAKVNGNSFNVDDFVENAKGMELNIPSNTENPQTTELKRLNSVKYAKRTLVNSNSYTDKKYTKIAKHELLDSSKVYMTHILSEYGTNNFIVDYQKSLSAFEGFDILDSVNLDLDKPDGTTVTLEFGTDIDKSSLVDLDTLHVVPVSNTYAQGFDTTGSYGNDISIISVDKGSVKLKLRTADSGSIKFLFINGVKDIKGNYIKPTVFPIWTDDAVTREVKPLTNDTNFKDLTPAYEGKVPEHYGNPIGTIKKKATIYRTNIYSLATWSSVEDGFKSYCPSNVDVLKEVRNRMFKYSFIYTSLRKSSIFPATNSELAIWDRFVVDGKQVEITLSYWSGWNLTITIYDKGDSWNTQYNLIGSSGLGYNVAYTDPKYPTLSWGYNFKANYFNSFKY